MFQLEREYQSTTRYSLVLTHPYNECHYGYEGGADLLDISDCRLVEGHLPGKNHWVLGGNPADRGCGVNRRGCVAHTYGRVSSVGEVYVGAHGISGRVASTRSGHARGSDGRYGTECDG